MADFKELIDSIRKEQVTLFLGSGFSRKAGAPMANAIVTSLKESMPVDIKDDFRDETHLDLISEEYEQIYGRESLINKLEEIFKFMPTDTSDHTCLTKIPHIRHIITTNYDTLIEDAFGPDNCYVVRTTDDCVNLPKDKTIIYKIHGDFTKKDNIILTKQDYTNFFSSNNEPLLWKYIQSHILTNDMLFIGYSLEDSNIFTLIQEIRKQVKVECIREWVEKNFEDENFMADAIDRLFGFLINKVKVIWYEVCEDEDPIALFTRLNIGRIQLTNAELIKALLLKEYEDDDVDKDQIERSMQWDHIEKELRSENDEVWYFLTTKDARLYPTRIELLFDMMANKRENEKEKYYTFFWFENEIKTKGVKTIWEEIQKNFLQIKEWYSDNLLYHKIGYLISSRTMNMMDIFKKAQGCRKSVFLNELDKMIAESINFQLKDENTYRDLNYEKNYKEISNLLLLFNIESIIKEQVYQRFPFSKYNTAEWSLEHIHAQNSQGLKKKETQIEWVKMHLESIISVNDKGQYDEIIAEMKNIISTNQIETRNVFDELFNKVCNALSEDSDSDYIHTLSNMALLTKNDNAALNNSTFDVKRNQIVSMDQRGAFIPYCTKMVFLKYYTPSRENQIHFWGQKDRIAYIKAMENIIQPYLTIINKTF